MIAVAALLIVGAAPALAAPGGVPGPPDGHIQGTDDVTVDDADADTTGPPDWAWAYGYRIKAETGLTYGHLLQCNDDVDAFEACTEALIVELYFPEEPGAKVFWTENFGELIAV